jgi:cation diffusion facilitator CzcD-associated flavoprotein CzcO
MDERPDAEASVAIIGAGFSGIGMAIRLKAAGVHDFMVFEAAGELGGTWRDNTYPGCACDVPSHLYSFSFERKPNWSRKYGPQPEIWDYLLHCADKYGVRPHVRTGTEIVEARFDETLARWELRSAAGQTFTARVLISGTGGLSRPAYPDLPGLSRFAGTTFHSAHWNHDFDFVGKRVGVVGTGASAIQFVPEIAARVKQLHVFQRTPPWIVPRRDRAFSDRTKRWFARVPALSRLYRDYTYWRTELRTLAFLDPRIMRVGETLARRHLYASVPDVALRARLLPDYRMGCKRVLISNDYYPALLRPNVELVTDPIEAVVPEGIVTRDGHTRELDAIVFGTGFRITEALSRVPVFGLAGRELQRQWRDGAEAYYGMLISGFPNFFMLTGPNTALGHNSIIFMIEAQVHYVMSCLAMMRKRKLRWLDVLPSTQRAFNEKLQARMSEAIWSSGCKSWYLDDNGRNVAIWPGFTFEYWLRTRRPDPRAFARV